VEEVLRISLRNKFKNYKPEPASMPFHTRLLGKDRLALYAFIHSLNTNFGSSIFEPVALALAKKNFKFATAQVIAGDKISSEAQKVIQKIIDGLTTANITPNKEKEIEVIRRVCQKGGMKKVKANERFVIDNQPIETQQFIQDVFKFWEDYKNKLKNSGKILLYLLLPISILALIILTPFLIKKSYSIPPGYADYVVLSEEKIDINKDGKDEKIVVVSNVPTEFTFGTTKILLIERGNSFLELPDDGGEFQWLKIDDFNQNGKTDIAVLYGYSGSAGFGQFYLYEWDDSNFITLLSREEINSKVNFKDLDNDGLKEMLYSYSPLKWDKEQQDVYKWDKESLSYIKL